MKQPPRVTCSKCGHTRRARTFGELLTHYRKAAALSQQTLARKARVSQPALSKLETGSNKPSFETAVQIAEALGVAVGKLLARRPK